ncbi:FxLYD domain-containing protein, partial [Halolamina salina]
GLAGCSGLGDGRDSPTDSPTASPTATPSTVRTPENGSLGVVEHTLSRSNEGSENELVAVEATIENGGSEPADVTATARFLDDAGAVIDESEASTTDLAAGGRWSVELLFGGSGEAARAVTDYRLAVERAD